MEKEYIASPVSDLEKDLVAINSVSQSLFNNLHHGDSLIYLIQHYSDTDSIDKKCYKHYLLSAANIGQVTLTKHVHAVAL